MKSEQNVSVMKEMLTFSRKIEEMLQVSQTDTTALVPHLVLQNSDSGGYCRHPQLGHAKSNRQKMRVRNEKKILHKENFREHFVLSTEKTNMS